VLRQENLYRKTPIQALIAVLSTSDYMFSYKTNLIGRVTHLFFAHPQSIKLFHQYPDVLLLDCTYKMNRFKLPLLNMVGTTCLNTTFYVAFCFLIKEEENDYVWALEQLKGICTSDNLPRVMVTDRELALMNGIRQEFL
jgi:MULE transposase domain